MAAGSNEKGANAGGAQGRLGDARLLIARALVLLDGAPPLIAAATLDLALHQLDRAIDASKGRHARAPAVPPAPRRSPK